MQDLPFTYSLCSIRIVNAQKSAVNIHSDQSRRLERSPSAKDAASSKCVINKASAETDSELRNSLPVMSIPKRRRNWQPTRVFYN